MVMICIYRITFTVFMSPNCHRKTHGQSRGTGGDAVEEIWILSKCAMKHVFASHCVESMGSRPGSPLVNQLTKMLLYKIGPKGKDDPSVLVPIPFVRIHYFVQPLLAMTVDKSQGQSVK